MEARPWLGRFLARIGGFVDRVHRRPNGAAGHRTFQGLIDSGRSQAKSCLAPHTRAEWQSAMRVISSLTAFGIVRS